jgi:hypothetical protein
VAGILRDIFARRESLDDEGGHADIAVEGDETADLYAAALLDAASRGDADDLAALAALADDPHGLAEFDPDASPAPGERAEAEEVSEGVYRRLLEESRTLVEAGSPGLVAKKITVQPKNGKPYQRAVMVRPDEAAGSTPVGGQSDSVGKVGLGESGEAGDTKAPPARLNTVDLRRAVTSDGRDPSVAMLEIIQKSAYKTGPLKSHGMTKKTPMVAVNLDGMEMCFEESIYAADGGMSVATIVAAIVYNNSDFYGDKDRFYMSPALANVTKRVVCTSQSNAADSHWAKQYGIKNFKSSGTGGDGVITLYGVTPGETAFLHSTFLHEAGHNLSTKVFGSTTPPADSEWVEAMKEGSVSEYGDTNAGEDFAESVMMYTRDVQSFAEKHPKRTALLNKYMRENRDPTEAK